MHTRLTDSHIEVGVANIGKQVAIKHPRIRRFDPRHDHVRLRLISDHTIPFPDEEEPEHHVRSITAKVLGDFEDGGTIVVARLDLYYLTDFYSPDISYWADEVSGDLSAVAFSINADDDLAPVIAEAYGDELWKQGLLVISSVVVRPELRGQGIGSKAINAVIAAFASCCGFVALKPFPIEVPKIDGRDSVQDQTRTRRIQRAGVKRLIRFYERLGFRRLTGEIMTYCCDLVHQPSVARCARVRRKHAATTMKIGEQQ